MNLQFLGGAGEIGRSAILVDDARLPDFGMATAPRFPRRRTERFHDFDG